jgi:hypothetical protein
MGAISSVNLLKNWIGIDQAEALVSMLQEHPTLKSLCGNKGNETELDMSGKMRFGSWTSEDAIMLVAEIVDNGALSKLIFGGDKYRGQKDGKRQDIYPEPAVLTMGMTEADFSNKNLGAGGAIIIAAWLTHKDKGALSKFTFSGDNSGSKPVTMETTMTEADFSGIICDAAERNKVGLGAHDFLELGKLCLANLVAHDICDG